MKMHALTLAALVAGATLSTGCTSAVDAYLKDASTDLTVAQQSSPPTCTEGDKGFSAIEREFEAVEPGTDAGTIRVATFYTVVCRRNQQVEAAKTGAPDSFIASVPVNEDLLDIMIRAYDEEPNAEYRSRMDVAFYSLDHRFKFAPYAGIVENGEFYPAPQPPRAPWAASRAPRPSSSPASRSGLPRTSIRSA